jgi:FG-GAP-like repeat
VQLKLPSSLSWLWGPLQTAILSVINAPTGEQQIGVFQQVGGQWELSQKITPYSSQMVNFVSYNFDRGTAELFELEPGVYGTAAGYSESKPIALFPGDSGTAVFKFSAAQISEPRSDGYYHQNDGLPVQILDFFRVQDDKLEKLSIHVINEDRMVNANFLDVIDFNADGLNDVAVYPYAQGGQPRVYLNTGGNVFIKVDQDFFPVAPAAWGGSASSKLVDLDQDGLLDLLYAPLNGFSLTDAPQLQWQTYLAEAVYDASTISTALEISNRLSSNLIQTWAGNDILHDTGASPSASASLINLGGGIDTVVYSGQFATYQLVSDGAFWRVTGGGDVVVNDRLTQVERLKFPDKNVALDLAASAGEVAKTLGAVFGKSAISNKEYAGIGLYFSDELNYSYLDLVHLAINARLGANPTHAQVVDLLYTNVVGQAPDAVTRKSYTDLLDNKTFSVGSLGVLAADTDLNKANINLVGLAQTGLEYFPFE